MKKDKSESTLEYTNYELYKIEIGEEIYDPDQYNDEQYCDESLTEFIVKGLIDDALREISNIQNSLEKNKQEFVNLIGLNSYQYLISLLRHNKWQELKKKFQYTDIEKTELNELKYVYENFIKTE